MAHLRLVDSGTFYHLLERWRRLGLTAGIFRFRASSSGAPAPGTPRTPCLRDPQRSQNMPEGSDELSDEMLALIDVSVDEQLEQWARSLIPANGAEVRKLTEEEVQLAVGKRASPRK